MSKDFTSMNNPGFLYQAALHHPFPGWAAEEPIPKAEEFEKHASTAFADPARRLLPISSKSAAFHSAINIFARPDDFDVGTLERVKEACAYYGIEQDILPYADLFVEEFEKEASLSEIPEGRFALDTLLGGEHFKMFPLNDADDVTASAFDLSKMAADNRIHILMMVPAAREIVKAAADHNIENLPEIVLRYGMERFPDAEKAASLIQGRAAYCKDPEIRDSVAADYEEAVQGVEEDPEGAMSKIAAIDHAAGVKHSYRMSSAVPTPFDIVFSGALDADAEKAARENVLVRLDQDVLVPLDEVERIDPTAADFKLSKSASETLSKLRDTGDARNLSLEIENWSEDDRRTFLRLAVDASPDAA